MFDPRPLCCSSLTTTVGGTTDTNFVDSAHPTVARIIGHVGFYRRFIKDVSQIAKPLSNLLLQGTPFEFYAQCMRAFSILKDKLVSAPIVVAPDWAFPFELMCDASDYAIGAVLGQKRERIF